MFRYKGTISMITLQTYYNYSFFSIKKLGKQKRSAGTTTILTYVF